MKRIVLILLYLALLLLIFLGLPDTILYAQEGFFRWLPFILIFGVQAVLVYAIARTFSINSYRSKGIAALAMLISGPLFGIYIGKKQEKELLNNGKTTIGTVYKKWKSKGNGGPEWLLKCQFMDDEKSYSTFSEVDRNNSYHLGDTLHILYSKNNPTNCVIVELEGK